MNAPAKIMQPDICPLECTREGLRALILDRDETAARLDAIDRRIAAESRAYANLLGEKMLPKLDRLRREVGAR